MSTDQISTAPPSPGAGSHQAVLDRPKVRQRLGIRRRGQEGVLPEALGLICVGATAAVLVASYFVADYACRRQFTAAWQQETETLARVLATTLVNQPSAAAETKTGKPAVAETGIAEQATGVGEHRGPARAPDPGSPILDPCLAELLQDLGHRARLRAVRWLEPNGATRLVWPAAPIPKSAGDAAGHEPPAGVVCASAPVSAGGNEPAGQLVIERYLPAGAGPRDALLWTWGVTAGFILVVFVAFYRRLRRHLRPLAAIENNLRSYGAGIEQELTTLALSDSLGAAAQGWNRLLAQVEEAVRSVAGNGTGSHGAPGAPTPTATSEVLARFENTAFRALVERLPFGVLRVAPDQAIGYANAAAAALLGRTGNDLAGRAVGEVIGSGAVLQAIASVQARPRTDLVADYTRKDGEQEWTLRFRVLPVLEPAARGEVLVTIEDVSQLREQERARDNFLYHVTHELRTPLTNIHAYAETLTKPGFDDEQTRRECYNVLISETQRLSRLVEDILSISQLEVGTARFEVGEVDLVRLVRQMVQDNLGAADEKRIDLTLALPSKVPKINGDKQRLAVLLNNLIGNAIKYTPENGKVQVKLEVGEQRILIAVSDTGLGISPKDQLHVFDKFYRAADEAVQMIPGTGLGLALAREVARLHGGDIHLQSELGKGSTFTVELPLAHTAVRNQGSGVGEQRRPLGNGEQRPSAAKPDPGCSSPDAGNAARTTP